ncbi:MAG TPA: hydroxyisourate hydrolase [Burkholderiales bacterium]
MGRITTHVLDTARGKPGAGIKVELYRMSGGMNGDAATLIASAVTNADGRTDKPMLEGEALRAGTYQLVFHVAKYFDAPAFYDAVPLRFQVADPSAHYHVPLLCSPWGYTTYRGS